MTVGKDAVVYISYSLKDDYGEILDSSEGQDDLTYLHGHDNIVAGLEEALDGKSVGDSVITSVSPEKGYGIRNDGLVFQMSRDKLPGEEIELGTQFTAQDKDGNQQAVTVVEITDENVTLDGNHPLADQTLHFDVTVNDIREAEAVELDHGHVHDPDHHHH